MRQQSPSWETALHEASHSIAVATLAGSGHVLEVSTVRDGDSVGRCAYTWNSSDSWGQFVVCAAGTVGARMLIPDAPRPDDPMAHILAESPPDWEICTGVLIDFYDSLGRSIENYSDTPLCRFLIGKTEKLIEQNRGEILTLAAFLETARTVDGALVDLVAHRRARAFGARYRAEHSGIERSSNAFAGFEVR